MRNKTLHMIAFILLFLGGLNLGLMGAFDWGIADVLGATATKIVYILVGLSALYEVITHKGSCKMCS